MNDKVYSRYSIFTVIFGLLSLSAINLALFWYVKAYPEWLTVTAEALIFVYVYIGSYRRPRYFDFVVNDEFINFINLHKLVKWGHINDIRITDDIDTLTILKEQLFEVVTCDGYIADWASIDIRYSVTGNEESLRFFIKQYVGWVDALKTIVRICKERGIPISNACINKENYDLLFEEIQPEKGTEVIKKFKKRQFLFILGTFALAILHFMESLR